MNCGVFVLNMSWGELIEHLISSKLFLLDHAEDDEGEMVAPHARYPWEGSDRDYEYEEVCHI